MDETKKYLEKLNIKSFNDDFESKKRFNDGAQYRFEVPGIQSPKAMSTLLEESIRKEIPIHRITQTKGVMLLSNFEISEMVHLAREYEVELFLSVGPRATYDTSATVQTKEGSRIGYRLRGFNNLVYAIEDVKKAVELGVRGILLYDEGLLYVLNQMRKGEVVEADYIVFACDIKYVFSKIIRRNKHTPKIIRKIFRNDKEFPMYSAFQMAFSVDGLFEEVEDTLGFTCNPIEVAMQRYDRIMVKNYRCYGDYIAPEGKTVIQCMFMQYEKDFKFWKKLYKSDRDRYKQAKLNIANAVLNEIINKFPQYEGKIKVLDTWTPYTYARRNNDTNGAFMRFITTAISRKSSIPSEVKGVDNVFLASHWLRYPGGLPMAAHTGKIAINMIDEVEKSKIVIPFIGNIQSKIIDPVMENMKNSKSN